MTVRCGCGWEALRGDPLPWLLDERQPNLHWRVLTELVGRPPDSPAVRRAQGGGSAAQPVARMIRDLLPDGTWSSGTVNWSRYGGPAWRLIAAVQWGADPSDPRLKAAAEHLLERTPGEGGVAIREGEPPSPIVTARLVQAVVGLGFGRHLRVQEALAWFEEDAGARAGIAVEGHAAAAALLPAMAASGELRRRGLVDRLVSELIGGGRFTSAQGARFGHPNLARTDLSEGLWALALAGIPYEPRLRPALLRLQAAQLDGGRWPVRHPVPASLPVDDGSRHRAGDPSPWITLRAVVAMNAYAVDAELPRLFPQRPA